MLLNVAAVFYAARSGRPKGRFMCVPYDFTLPTRERVKDRIWNSGEGRLFTLPIFGAGWSLNVRELAQRMGLLDSNDEPEQIAQTNRTPTD